MGIWILRPTDEYGKGGRFQDAKDDDPWNPWYDKCFGVVVVAETEADARRKASNKTHMPSGAWEDSTYSKCVPIEEYAEQEDGDILMKDVHQA